MAGGDLGVRRELSRALELVKRSHPLCDRRGELDEVRRHRRIGLERVESARERLARRS